MTARFQVSAQNHGIITVIGADTYDDFYANLNDYFEGDLVALKALLDSGKEMLSPTTQAAPIPPAPDAVATVTAAIPTKGTYQTNADGVIILNVPYDDKDEAKLMGARWQAKEPPKGKWGVNPRFESEANVNKMIERWGM
jgi:uncharacterized protein DUF5710